MTPAPDIESSFMTGCGRVARLLERLGLARGNRLLAKRLAMVSVALTWVPLLILSIIERVAWGARVPVAFLEDFLPYGQFLVAVPVLIFGEVIVGRRLGLAIAELRRSDVLTDEDMPELERLLAGVLGRWRGAGVHTVLVLLTLGATIVSVLEVGEWLTGGWQWVGGSTTAPGWWYLLISLPIMRFLALRWIWRLLLWIWVLWRLARLDLRPQPAHPDRAGGLGFLGETQVAFGVLALAFGVQLSCLAADAVHFRGADLMTYRGHLFAFVVIVLIVLLVPLVVFAPRLIRAREEHLQFLSSCGYHGAKYLERKLRSSPEGKLPAEDVSGLTDFGALYENARLMRPVPLETRHVIMLLMATVVPFLPLLFLIMPAQDVFRALAQLLI
jgi:hypothetical protein